MFLPRKLMTLSGYDGVAESVRSMVGAIMILVLAWSLGGVPLPAWHGQGRLPEQHRRGAGSAAGGHLRGGSVHRLRHGHVGNHRADPAHRDGVFPAQDPLFLVAIGATLGSAVYGTMCRPFGSTILSSAGAQCNHLRHVATQLPYASVVAAVCLVGYIIAGFTGNPWIALVVGAVLMIAAVLVLNRSKYGAVKA
ncbi:MAG: Na+/H+ antiporter NhaC family protein [Eggerthella lenta]